MRALKSHRYVQIMNNNNGLVFRHEIFRIYSVLSFKFVYCKKFDYSQQRYSYRSFCVTTERFLRNKNGCTENFQWHKIIRVSNNINKPSDFLFNVNVRCVSLGFCTKIQLLCILIIRCASFSLSIKRREITSCWFASTFQCSVVLVIIRKFRQLLFWKFMSLKTSSAVMYYLSCLHYIGFYCKHFWTRKNC